MAEAAKVRLVRCPKCENLLPELPDFSLYQCGGCGAVLKAKQKGILEDGLTEVSDALKGRGILEESNIIKVSEVKMESADSTGGGALGKTHNEVMTSNCSSTSRAKSMQAVADSNLTRRGKERVRKLETFDNEYISYPQGPVCNRTMPNIRDSSVDVPEYANFHGEHVKDIRPPMELLRPSPVMDQGCVKTNGPGCGPARGVSAQMKFDDFRYYDKGQSSSETNCYYEQDERASRYRGPMENLENGRAELIRRLDELKDQISQSCDISDKSKERMISSTSPDPYDRRQAAYNYHGPPYFTDPHGYIPYTDRYNPHALDPYPGRRYPHEFRHYSNNAYKPGILRRPPSGIQSQYTQQNPYHEHFSGYYGNVNHDLFMFHGHENFFHQPACSCVHCCDKNWHNRRIRNEPSNPNLLRPQGNNCSGGSNLHQLGPQKSLPMNSNALDSEHDGFNYHRPRKLVVGRVSRPIAGGAPFIACNNCFGILKLPMKHVLLGENQQKLKCGSCSSIILFELGNKGFIASGSAHVDQVPIEIDEGSSGTLDENARYWNDRSNSANLNTSSNDYDDFHDKKSDSCVSEKQLDPLSSTSSLSEDEGSPENKLPGLTEVKSLPDQDSTPQDEINRFDKRNKSQRPAHERVSLDRTTSRPNSVKDAGVATEIDVPLNGFSNSCASQDSVETSNEAKSKVNKGGESFFAGLIKKSFKDFKKSSQGVEVGGSQVFVNGHFIPGRVVKKAEKLAGPIQSGEYWYDKRAGFWGVMGHPCLGIIMPNIEEFDYPMPENCAAGNTGVFVNGRQLHQKDLDLLSSRGLPITINRSYLVEITGKVIDEQTGEELDGLGKLAPTVERATHGFGMRVPRFIAQPQS